MAYRILVDGELLWDAVSDADVVSSASISQAVNAAAYLDMEVSPDAAPRVSEGSSAIEVRWGATTLFHGRATEVSQGTEGTWRVSAVSDVDRLNDVLVRPHSTSGDVGDECPDTPGAYFAWLVARYDERAVGGYRIDVRVNQGDQLADGAISVSDDSWPTVAAAMEDVVLSRGGYLDFTPYAGGGVIDLYADLHDANAQLVDLGENVTDITVTRSTDAQRTALVPYGSDDDGNEWTLSGATESDLQLVRNAGYSVFGDAVYDGSYVAEYGYREERREFPGVTSVAELIREAIPYLRTMVAPTLTVECRAVDMALYREGYEHLRVGQAVRVRSEPHGVDEYLAVQDMALDLLDPSQTAYTLGVSYDTLTGSQSAYLSRLNGEINHALDRVTEAEDSIRHVVNDVDVEYYVSDSPDEPVGGEWGVGTVTAVDNKYVFSHLKQTSADGTVAISDPTLLTTQVRHSLQLHRDLGDEVVWVSYVAANYDVTDDAAGIVRLYGQMGGWEAEEQGAVTVAFGFQDSAYQAAGDGESLAGVGVVTEKSSDIDLGRADIVSYVDNGRVGIYVRLTGKVLVNLYADGEGFSTPFVELTSEPSGTKVFDLADAQTTYESAILQADNAIRLYVAATYATQGQLGEVESAFDVRANQIEASVSEKMDTSVANQTFVNQSTFDQFSDSITTTVSETVQTADEAYTKASQVEQTVDGIEVTLTEVQTTAEGAASAASSAQSTASSALTTANAASAAATNAAKVATNYLKFDSSGLCVGNMTASSLGMNTLVAAAKVALRNGTTELATFSPSLIELGRNSKSSQIKMMGGSMTMSVTQGDTRDTAKIDCGNLNISAIGEIDMSAGSSCNVHMGYQSFQYNGHNVLTDNVAYVRGNCRIFVGSRICSSWDGNTVRLFTEAEFRAIVGRNFNGDTDCVAVMNGDARVNRGYQPLGCGFWSGGTGFWVACGPQGSGTGSGTIRVNYIIAAP